MEVVKRDGTREPVKFDKISARIKKQTYGLNEDYVDYVEVSRKVIAGLYDGVTTEELDVLAAETAASLITNHPDYSKLASRIAISSLYKRVDKHFSSTAKKLYEYINPKTGEKAGMISDETYSVIEKYGRELDAMMVHDRDFNFDYFGFKTLEKSYLLKMYGQVAETPQHLYMRVSVGIWGDNLEMVQKTYDMLSEGLFTHATPTLFNAGTKRPQLSSCFLIDVHDDSIPGIYKTLSDAAVISQNAGGIGINIHKIRAKGAYIKGTNGTSNGIVPMLKVFNETARYVDQGGGKRKGSIAIYLEPWHADVEDFLDLRKNHGKEEMRARDLFLALWTPNLFMERVESGGDWSLFSPDEVPGLVDAYDNPDDKKFTKLYEKYESEGKAIKVMKARDLWEKILDAQIETGTPYMLYKDQANSKSNQKNLGTIKSSNLCTEIIEYTDCLSFESEEAQELNKNIFETMYFAAMTASKDLAKKDGPYESFKGSPTSKGIFQYDMWGYTEDHLSGMWDWYSLKKEVMEVGLRNSLLMAPMPTASTAQILGNNECFEPFTANLYKRNTLSGEYVIINKYLIEDLVNLGLWNEKIRLQLFAENGSVQNIESIPSEIRETYKTVWEMKGKTLLDMARDRAVFIDQSQSLNLFMQDVTHSKLSSAHMYGWKLGLKTGMYYLRTKAKASAIKGLGVDMSQLQPMEEPTVVKNTTVQDDKLSDLGVTEEMMSKVCSLDDPNCLTCSA